MAHYRVTTLNSFAANLAANANVILVPRKTPAFSQMKIGICFKQKMFRFQFLFVTKMFHMFKLKIKNY